MAPWSGSPSRHERRRGTSRAQEKCNFVRLSLTTKRHMLTNSSKRASDAKLPTTEKVRRFCASLETSQRSHFNEKRQGKTYTFSAGSSSDFQVLPDDVFSLDPVKRHGSCHVEIIPPRLIPALSRKRSVTTISLRYSRVACSSRS